MDKSTPRWVMVHDRTSKPSYKRKLEPLKHCSDSVSHQQLVHALKTTNSLPGMFLVGWVLTLNMERGNHDSFAKEVLQ